MKNQSPWVCVTTYAQHNKINGRVFRFELDDFDDRSDFLTYCADLFHNESDPGFMFVDWSSDLKAYISEPGIDPAAFELAKLDETDRDIIAAWCSHFGVDQAIPRTDEQFQIILGQFKGNFPTGGDFAEYQWQEDAESQGIELNGLLGQLAIDWQATWNADFGFEYIQVLYCNQNYFFNQLTDQLF